MLKPYYEIDEAAKRLIFGLQGKAIELGLGNVSFHLHQDDTINFHLVEYQHEQHKVYWELTVRMHWSKKADLYKIIDGDLIYRYSEKD